MAPWTPAPGETLLARDSIAFASGTADTVDGMRWFRDTERRDIQGELVLSGWPKGPVYTPNPAPPSKRRAPKSLRKAGLFGLGALAAVVLVVLAAILDGASPSGGSGGGSRGPGRPRKPEDEVDDFPVMWAAPGSMARTLPWQLDPARRPDGDYRTHLVVTDRRIVVLGFPGDDPDQDEVLWEIGREHIASVERMPYSKVWGDVKICFADGSWCRLAPPEERFAWRVPIHLVQPTGLVAVESLPRRHRAYIAKHVVTEADRDPTVDPIVTRRPNGKFLVETTRAKPVHPKHGVETEMTLLTKRGLRMAPMESSLW
ncbi:hypothetical protein ACQB60_26340 [Actinomycetota bacterium Odt1-20B]